MTKLYRLMVVASLAFTLALAACGGKNSEPAAEKPKSPSAGSSANKSKATGTITAVPNPIKVCDGSGSGITTVYWTSNGAKEVEIRVGKPDGDLFVKAGLAGKWATGKWVGGGMAFYLQDVSDGRALAAENTIATVSVAVTTQGCP